MSEQEYETWQANGRIVLYKTNRLGSTDAVLVNRGRRIQLTEQERIMNQDRVADEKQDPFANGTLSPVRLPDSSKESAQAIVDNPNTMSEEDMVKILDGHHKTFEKKLAEISSPYVVRRMLAIAQSDDVDITVKRVEAIETRLRDLTVDTDIPVVEHQRIT
jgi:hypothetical protein